MSVRPLNPEKTKWQIDYYPEGRKGKRERVTYNGSEDEVTIYEQELRQQHVEQSSQKNNPRIMDIIKEFLDWHKLHRAESTHVDFRKSIKNLKPLFWHLPVSRITRSIIDKFKLSRNGKNRSINKDLDYLSGLISWMVERSYAKPLPFKFEKVPYKRPLPVIPHPRDIEKMIAKIRGVSYTAQCKKAMALMMWEAGTRWKDTRLMRWEKISWEKEIVTLEETKGDKPRIALLPRRVKEILLPLKKEKGYIFINVKTGEPYVQCNKMFRGASKRAGLQTINPHLLRHARATYMLEATGNIRKVQEMLGHEDVRTTEFYTQVAAAWMKEGAEITDQYIQNLIDS